MRLRLLLALPLALAAGAYAAAGHAGALDGFVRSGENGETIAFARVSLDPDSTGPAGAAGPAIAPARTLTNAAGYYAIRGVPPGVYRLNVRAVGFTPREERVRVGDAPGRLNVTLDVAPFQVPTVTVKGDSTRSREEDLQSGFTEISAKQLARLPAVGEQDIIRSLQLLPGIQSASDVSS